MNIVFLDAKTIGEDIDLSGYDKLGTVIKYGLIITVIVAAIIGLLILNKKMSKK